MLRVPDHVLLQACHHVQDGSAVDRLCDWWNSERALDAGLADIVAVYVRRGGAWRSICPDDTFARMPGEIERCSDCARAGSAILEFRRLATDGGIDLVLDGAGNCIESAPAHADLFRKWSRRMVAELARFIAHELDPPLVRGSTPSERRTLETT